MAEAAQLLPDRMASNRADALLLAIGLQESLLVARRQHNNGPARGLWQFERGGSVRGVLTHPATSAHARRLCELRGVAPVAHDVWEALEHDDVLAAGFARLNLWWLPQSLPELGDGARAFQQYLDAWRPGAYTRGDAAYRSKLRAKFLAYYAEAVDTVKGEGA